MDCFSQVYPTHLTLKPYSNGFLLPFILQCIVDPPPLPTLPPLKVTYLFRQYCFFRRPDSRLTDEYAGFLFGLGLLGHLADFPTFTLCDFLSNSHETTSIALLLGLSCNKRGTMDAFMSKMLSIHVHGLMPSTSVEVGVTPLVQNAALVAVGLLYQGTCHRRTAEVRVSLDLFSV
jgi:hypothetical protein